MFNAHVRTYAVGELCTRKLQAEQNQPHVKKIITLLFVPCNSGNLSTIFACPYSCITFFSNAQIFALGTLQLAFSSCMFEVIDPNASLRTSSHVKIREFFWVAKFGQSSTTEIIRFQRCYRTSCEIQVFIESIRLSP